MRAIRQKLHTRFMQALELLGVYELLVRIDRRPRILLYHGVTKAHPSFDKIENHRRKHVAVDAFKKHIEYLSSRFTVVPLATLISEVEKGGGKGMVAITFDDGYENVCTEAYPILKEHNAPMTFYIVRDFIEAREPLWVDRIEYAIDATAKETISIPLEQGSATSFSLKTREEKISADNAIRTFAKRVPNAERLRIIADVERECGVSLRDVLTTKPDYRPASREQLSTLLSEGLVEFGGHTLSHPILSNLTHDELETEIEGSTTFIQSFGVTPTTFAYPNGGREDYTEKVIDVLKSNGYTNAPITDETFLKKGVPPYRLPRITIDNANAMHHFLFRLTGVRFMLMSLVSKLRGR
jgi:peptidoglycan/xylan/chitin deacetylase (PgdA/CDA1 family)